MLRNNSRFRRDQRQLTEEEEMWFNEEDDFEDVPADSKLDSMGESWTTSRYFRNSTNLKKLFR
jgi:hypothetical protein